MFKPCINASIITGVSSKPLPSPDEEFRQLGEKDFVDWDAIQPITDKFSVPLVEEQYNTVQPEVRTVEIGEMKDYAEASGKKQRKI